MPVITRYLTAIMAALSVAALRPREVFSARLPNPVFYVPFDGRVTGHFGKFFYPAASARRDIKYGSGFIGQAAFVRRGLEYPIAGIFSAQKGTFSLWLKLENKAKCLVLPKKGRLESIACVGTDSPRLSALVGDGKWHHCVYTWDLKLGQKQQYLDGARIGRATYRKAYLERRFLFGAGLNNWIDELVLLADPLSGRQVKALFAEYGKGRQPFEELPHGSAAFYPLDVSRSPRTRPALPARVDWRSAKLTSLNKTRTQLSLAGYWRIQPLGFMHRTPQEGQWLYVRLPSAWLPYPTDPVLYDQSLKPLPEYNYLRRKMVSAARTSTDISVDDEPEGLDDDLPLEPEQTSFREPGTYNGSPITNYCSVVLEREFQLPPDTRGKQVLLRLSRVGGIAVYVNDHYLANVSGIEEAALNLTDHIHRGKANRLTFVLGNSFRPMQSAGVTCVPVLEIRDTNLVKLGKPLIVPSYREKKLKVYLPAENLAGRELDLTMGAELYDAGGQRRVKSLGSRPVALKKGATGDALIEFPAEGLREWTPETPNLYHLGLEVRHSGTLLDVVPPERFGYREVWAEGGDVYLNGKRLSLRGKSHSGWVAFTPFQIDLMRKVGMNSARTLDWNDFDLEPLKVTDEKGFLVNIAMYISPHDEQAARAYFRKLMTVLGNHPSIIEWMIGGRGYPNGPHGHPVQIGGLISEEAIGDSLHYRTGQLINKIDPTGRLTFYHTAGVGGNVRGIMHSLSFGTPIQEMEEWVSHWAKVKPAPFVPREQQIFSRPDYFFHRGSKASIVLEQHARYFGEASYRKATEELIERWREIDEDDLWATPEYWADMYELAFTRALRSWRTYGISGYWFHASFHLQTLYEKSRAGGPLTSWGEVVKRINAPCIFYIGGPKQDFVSKGHNYFAGEEVAKSAIVVNDTLHDVRGTLSWEATTRGGARVASGKQQIVVSQGTQFFQPVTLKCPDVTERTALQITAAFSAPAENLTLSDTFDIAIFPEAPKPEIAGAVALVDTSGQTANVLKKLGVQYRLLTEQSKPKLSSFELLIIGKSSFPAATRILGGAELNAAIDQGLNVLVLEQMNRNVAGLTTECFKTRRVFLGARDSGLLAGFQAEDFIDWRGESTALPAYQSWCAESNWRVGANLIASKHGQANSFRQGRFWHWSNKGMVATFCYQKPQLGNYRVLLQNGFDVLYTPLVEFHRGKGRVLFSQLELTDLCGKEPVAAQLLHRALQELSEPSDREFLPIGLLGGQEGRDLMELLAIDYQPGLDGKVAYVSLAETDDKDAIASFVRGGGTVVTCIQSQTDADKLPVAIRIREGQSPEEAEAAVETPKLEAPALGPADGATKGAAEDDQLDLLLEGEKKGAEPEGEISLDEDSESTPGSAAESEGDAKYFKAGVPPDPVFSGMSLSDLYYRRSLKAMTVVESVDGKPAVNALVGVIPCGRGRIVYLQPHPHLLDDRWQKSKVLRLYNTVLTNLGARSKAAPDFSLVGGYGLPEEWMPGYAVKVPDIKKRPMVKESPLYWKPALNFDPNVHYVW